ncbi:aspartate/glutamate racemase family protein [Robiginitalea sp. SC105]|uniref:aspartate/glutamate racemase family protein n=1 Tax=Robiginitalea sp. SC105 TaxID=2762332 RepID=UPI0016396655|nr:amino acid racemase [Robiginitalea sp. SC105]MBC2838778.1 amino acid racemase [Robiginitalea sp. SC105]
MRILGLIGGTSWHATMAYYKLINEGVGKHIGTQANPELIICSINIEIMREQNLEKIRAKYFEVSERLIGAGAEGILICANTPHMVYDYVQPKISVPILHIAEATGKEATRLGLKKLGLLGNRPTMTGTFIPGYLKTHFGIETMIPEDQYLSEAHRYVSEELTRGKFTAAARAFFLHQIDLLRERGADGIILGCTELPLLIDAGKVGLPTLPTTDLHARMAIDFIMG